MAIKPYRIFPQQIGIPPQVVSDHTGLCRWWDDNKPDRMVLSSANPPCFSCYKQSISLHILIKCDLEFLLSFDVSGHNNSTVL